MLLLISCLFRVGCSDFFLMFPLLLLSISEKPMSVNPILSMVWLFQHIVLLNQHRHPPTYDNSGFVVTRVSPKYDQKVLWGYFPTIGSVIKLFELKLERV